MNFYYPINLNLTGRRVVIIGGGKVAERKIASFLGTGAEIIVVSPKATPVIEKMASENIIYWKEKSFSPEEIKEAFLVIAATDDKQTNIRVKQSADKHQLVSIVDAPEISDFHTPSVLRRGKLSIAVSTSGASPILAKKIRNQLENEIDAKYEEYLDFLSDCRSIILEKVNDPKKKQLLLTAIVSQSFLESQNRQKDFETLLKQVLKD